MHEPCKMIKHCLKTDLYIIYVRCCNHKDVFLMKITFASIIDELTLFFKLIHLLPKTAYRSLKLQHIT